jgi:hypothetical protein
VDSIWSPQSLPFLAAFLLMLLVGLVQLLGLGDVLEGADNVGEAPAGLGAALDWLNVGRLPLLAFLVILLFAFGSAGLLVQGVARLVTGAPLPWFIASPLAAIAAVPLARMLGGGLSRILPRDESSAVSRSSLVGLGGTIVLGEARAGSAAQARVRDGFGQTHYVLVEPDDPEETLGEGSEIRLVGINGAWFSAIPAPPQRSFRTLSQSGDPDHV